MSWALNKMYSPLIIAGLLVSLAQLSVQQCSVNIKKDIAPQNSPLFIDPSNEEIIRTADVHGNIGFSAGQQVRLACPGVRNSLTISPNNQEKIATCVNGQTFAVDKVNYNFNKFDCTFWPKSSYKNSTKCLTSMDLIEVGFQTSKHWIVLFKVCHDSATFHTHYTEFYMRRDAATSQKGAGRADWEQGKFFP